MGTVCGTGERERGKQQRLLVGGVHQHIFSLPRNVRFHILLVFFFLLTTLSTNTAASCEGKKF